MFWPFKQKEIHSLDRYRYANFRVLKAPDIPSVLIEMGFLTNADDEAQLKSQNYLEVITKSMARTVRKALD
jgi:N-acetylmuramoyl-L-alanine amidase